MNDFSFIQNCMLFHIVILPFVDFSSAHQRPQGPVGRVFANLPIQGRMQIFIFVAVNRVLEK